MSNLCGNSCGEALSRWVAMVISNNALSDFATAPTWFADGMPNFVDTVDPTDQNADSTGCGMAFLSWLMKKGNYSLSEVAQAMVALGDAGTLAALYNKIGAGPTSGAWNSFSADITALPSGVTSDDPFSALGGSVPVPPTPPVPPVPPTPPGSGTSVDQLGLLIASAWVDAKLAGDTEPILKASIQKILDADAN